MRQRADGFIQDNATTIEDFLKLCCGLASLMYGKIGFAAQVDGVQIGPVVEAERRQTKFIGSRGRKTVERLLRTCVAEREPGAKRGQVVRHPPQSGWLGEWGRLKGGCPVGLGVAL